MTHSASTQLFPYARRGGITLELELHLPANRITPTPIVMGIPGGGWRSCSRDGVPRELVDHGLAMAVVSYRLSSDAIAPANLIDCLDAVRWVRRHAATHQLAADRIGVYGASAGGHLAALMAAAANMPPFIEDDTTDATDPKDEADATEQGGRDIVNPSASVQAVCAVCGPMDLSRCALPAWRSRFELLYDVTQQYLGGPVENRSDLAATMSPKRHVTADGPPMLLVHGSDDEVVPVEESQSYHAALQQAGAESELIVVDGAPHGWMAKQTSETVAAFFQRTIGRPRS